MGDDPKAGETETKEPTLLERVLRISGEHVENCYNCGKCTAGCPIAFEMELHPQQMMRMVQLDMTDRALKANTMWLCSACETCSTRCPMEVGVAEVMDALRRMALEQGVKPPAEARSMRVFHQEFLNCLKRWGRVNEHELIGMYKMKTGELLDDVGLGIRLFGKQKIKPWHMDRVRRTEQMAKLFEAALNPEEDH